MPLKVRTKSPLVDSDLATSRHLWCSKNNGPASCRKTKITAPHYFNFHKLLSNPIKKRPRSGGIARRARICLSSLREIDSYGLWAYYMNQLGGHPKMNNKLTRLKKTAQTTKRFCYFFAILMFALNVYSIVNDYDKTELIFICLTTLPIIWLAENQLQILKILKETEERSQEKVKHIEGES